MSSNPLVDVVIIGAGPAGLTAALYLARYHRHAVVLHNGKSRALRIPKTYNVPGFSDGINGKHLIERMTEHALRYGARIEEADITEAYTVPDGFSVRASDGRGWQSRALILATGVRLNQVDLPDDAHEQAIEAGVLRYCPVCDGYEHTNARIGVIGCDSNGAAEALFLRKYSADITLMPLNHSELSHSDLCELEQAGINVKSGALIRLEPQAEHMDVHLEGHDAALSFDVIYPALGTAPQSALARQLGMELTQEDCIPFAAVRDSGVPGLFAAGDVIEGLDQISVAFGHGAMAATKAHNWLTSQDKQLSDPETSGHEYSTPENEETSWLRARSSLPAAN